MKDMSRLTSDYYYLAVAKGSYTGMSFSWVEQSERASRIFILSVQKKKKKKKNGGYLNINI